MIRFYFFWILLLGGLFPSFAAEEERPFFEIIGSLTQKEAGEYVKKREKEFSDAIFYFCEPGIGNSKNGVVLKNAAELSSKDSDSGKKIILFQLNRIDKDEKELLTNLPSGVFSSMTLLDAAMIAEGGIAQAKRSIYRQKYVQYQVQVRKKILDYPDPQQRARFIFEYMHHNILTGKYSLNNSSLVALFENGVFNCVSATILYNILAKDIDLTVLALETTGHTKSRVFFLDGFLDIETTCVNWDLLPDRMRCLSTRYTLPPNTRELIKSSGFATEKSPSLNKQKVSEGQFITPEEAQARRLVLSGRRIMREIDDIQIIAMIYYNRGVDFYQEKSYNKALAAYLKALCLDSGNKTILRNFKATINNWAIQLAEENCFKEAIHLVEMGQILDPDFIQFRENLPIFYQHWIAELEEAKRTEEAEYLFRKFELLFPEYIQPE